MNYSCDRMCHTFSRGRYLTRSSYVRKSPERRSSLPPLTRPQVPNVSEKLERDLGGETSGYGSDSANYTPEHAKQGGYESSSSYKDERMRWGAGKFWESDGEKANEPPNWVKRGLQRQGELVVANSSPSESPEQDCENERPCTGSSGSNR